VKGPFFPFIRPALDFVFMSLPIIPRRSRANVKIQLDDRVFGGEDQIPKIWINGEVNDLSIEGPEVFRHIDALRIGIFQDVVSLAFEDNI